MRNTDLRKRWMTVTMSKRYSPNAWKPGMEHPNAKLTDDDIREIRLLYFSDHKITQQQIADRYGVSQAHIGKILNGLRWSHVK